jgi:hypothetical protein
MRTHVFKFLTALFLVAFGFNDGAAEFQRDIPKATWEPIFFEPINQLATKAGWKPLREAPLPTESMEVRVWIGFGLSPLQGYSLRRDGSRWTGSHIIENSQQINSVAVREVTPMSGWDTLWTRLVQLGLLALPDSSTLHDEEMINDGVSYVVEMTSLLINEMPNKCSHLSNLGDCERNTAL